VVVSLAGMLVSVGLLSLLFFSAAFKGDTVHFELTLSRPLIIGLFVLLALLNTYLVTKRFEVRRLREQLISATLQNQVTEQQSFIDPLTEIYNRRSLDGIAGRLISQAKRRKTPLSLMMIDANRFKEINNRFGHLTGDFVLSALAGILKDSVRGSDTVLRYGGDEFLILLADTYAEGAHTVADRINDKLNDWNEAGNLDRCTVSVSIGVAEWQDGDTLDMMLDAADRSMYEHKNHQVYS
jgi:diguanylate cyclase (GGDEF)-like protein